MSRKITLTLLVALSLFGLGGCAVRIAMSHMEGHYNKAKSLAKDKAYSDADAEMRKVEAIFASDDIVKAYDSPRFAQLHAQLTANLAVVRAKLKAKNADQTMAAFKVASATCKACHKEF